jgi:hypothetical protein
MQQSDTHSWTGFLIGNKKNLSRFFAGFSLKEGGREWQMAGYPV